MIGEFPIGALQAYGLNESEFAIEPICSGLINRTWTLFRLLDLDITKNK